MSGYRVVVTRYGGRRHLGRYLGADTLVSRRSRHMTACRTTSSWTIEEWARAEADPEWEGHPQGLTAEQMKTLPPCEACAGRVRYDLPPAEIDALFGVTPRHTGRGLTALEQQVVDDQGWNADSLVAVLLGWNPNEKARLQHMLDVAAEENS
jgi:hypothetical protein